MIRAWLEQKVKTTCPGVEFEISIPPEESLGDYSTNVAFTLAKQQKTSPLAVAQKLADMWQNDVEFQEKFDVISAVAPGFVNFNIKGEALRDEFEYIRKDKNLGLRDLWRGKTVMVEYTDPNPFKQFHIGHLMTNVIGESVARVYEANGAKVLRVNYQGDVGVHVACSLWGMMLLNKQMPREKDPLQQKTEFMGRAYVLGATAYKDNPTDKVEIDAVNKKVYDKSDVELNALYDRGRQWSLDYFETIYARLGTKFDHYFFESEVGVSGKEIVKAHPEVFVESQGAVIFPGEKYGLHTRVFINSQGLPVYEAKELALNKKKFELYHPDLSLVVTGNEINEYFRVLLKAMELTMSDVANQTRHIGHGMLKLPTGKMSSRTGDVVTAEMLLGQVKKAVLEKIKDREGLSGQEREDIAEQVAFSAIRYSILKQGMGKDIIFDMEASISFQGDSGPYLQYTYARLASIVAKVDTKEKPDLATLVHPTERTLMRHLLDFGDVAADTVQSYSLNGLVLYLYELTNKSNRFYEEVRILEDEDVSRQAARVQLIQTVMTVLGRGLELLGIRTLMKM